jgi:rhamnosyltransferase
MKNILGLVVTFDPPESFLSNLHLLLAQLDFVLVIDNRSAAETRRKLESEVKGRPAKLKIVFNDENLGLGGALNQGFQWALMNGYQAVMTFDQDSRPAQGMIERLWQTYASHPEREQVAVVAPSVVDGVSGERIAYLRRHRHFLIERVPCREDRLEEVLYVITSGSLNILSAYSRLGGFREDFFIDYVDTEYCLRAGQRGYKIFMDCGATLQHRLGEQQKKNIGPFTLRPTFHSPVRWYYINRNRLVMYGLYLWKLPSWVAFDLMTAVYAFLKMLLYEDQKLKKTRAVLLGFWDGILLCKGPISPRRAAQLTPDK